MGIESLVEQIMERVYDTAALHDDPVVQERIVETDVRNLIEDYVDEIEKRYERLLEEAREETESEKDYEPNLS